VSKYSEKGQHTTTFAELYEINNNTAIIDTPGLKSFGLTSIELQELKDFFPEMLRLSKDCKFNNCLHLNEPNCHVRDAYEKSELPWFRYEHYQMLLKEISE
jgi:ribosome biogenesis GTPase